MGKLRCDPHDYSHGLGILQEGPQFSIGALKEIWRSVNQNMKHTTKVQIKKKLNALIKGNVEPKEM